MDISDEGVRQESGQDTEPSGWKLKGLRSGIER